jgi:hypothetical protein
MAQTITLNHVKAPGRRGFDPMIDIPGTDDARTQAFARAAQSYLTLMRANVGQADFAPRNILLARGFIEPDALRCH